MNAFFKKKEGGGARATAYTVFDDKGEKLTLHVKRERAINGRTGQVSLGSGRAAGHKHHPYSVPGVGDRVQNQAT